MLGSHQRGQHFNLQSRNVGEEAHAVADAAFMCLQHIEYIAHQVQRALLHTVAAAVATRTAASNPATSKYGLAEGSASRNSMRSSIPWSCAS